MDERERVRERESERENGEREKRERERERKRERERGIKNSHKKLDPPKPKRMTETCPLSPSITRAPPPPVLHAVSEPLS